MDEARRHFHDRDLAAEPPVHLGEFQPDIAAADDHQMPRQKVDPHHRAVRQIGHLIEPGQVRHHSPAPDVDEDAFGDEDCITDLNRVRCDKAAMALIDRAIRQAPQALLDPDARLLGNPVLSGFYPRHVDMHRTFEADPELAGSAHHMRHIGAGDQCLGGNASGVDAGAAKRPAFNDRNGHARCREAPRQGRSGLPGADDDGVVFGDRSIRFCHACPLNTLVIGEPRY